LDAFGNFKRFPQSVPAQPQFVWFSGFAGFPVQQNVAVGREFYMGIIAGFERNVLPSAPSVRRTQKRVIDRRFKNARIRPNDVVIVVDDDAVASPQRLLAFQVPSIPNV